MDKERGNPYVPPLRKYLTDSKLTAMDFLSYFALGILFFVVLVLSYGMIAIHDIPYHMALKRNHPPRRCHSRGWGGSVSLRCTRSGHFSGFGRPHITRSMAMPERPEEKPTKPGRRDPTQTLRVAALEKENCGSRSERIQVQRSATQNSLRLWIYFSFLPMRHSRTPCSAIFKIPVNGYSLLTAVAGRHRLARHAPAGHELQSPLHQ